MLNMGWVLSTFSCQYLYSNKKIYIDYQCNCKYLIEDSKCQKIPVVLLQIFHWILLSFEFIRYLDNVYRYVMVKIYQVYMEAFELK